MLAADIFKLMNHYLQENQKKRSSLGLIILNVAFTALTIAIKLYIYVVAILIK